MGAAAAIAAAQRETNRQNGQKLPDRLPARPAPSPANDKSWQGKEPQIRSGVAGGRSLAAMVPTSASNSSAPPQFVS